MSNSNFPCYVVLTCFWYVEFYSVALFVELCSFTQLCCEFIQIVLDTSSSILQRVSLTPSASQLNSAVSQLSPSASQLNSSASLLNSAVSLLNSVSGSCHFCILTVWKVPSASGSFHLAYSVKSSVILYSAICSITSSVSCIKSLHYMIDSGLCITLQLWNTV